MSEKNVNLKKKPSGYEYRKRKLEKDQEIEKYKKSMNLSKYLIPSTSKQANNLENETVASTLEKNIPGKEDKWLPHLPENFEEINANPNK